MKSRLIVTACVAVVITSAAFLLLGMSSAQQVTYAYATFDDQFVVANSTIGKRMKQELDADFAVNQEKIQRLQTDLEHMKTQLDREQNSLSEEQLLQRQAQLQSKAMEYQQMYVEIDQQMREKYARQLEKLTEIIKPVVQQYAEENGFAMVLSKANPSVWYTHDSIDITDIILERLNSQR